MRKPLDESESKLFQDAVGDAAPLEHDQADPYRRLPPPVPIQQPSDLSEGTDPASLSEAEVETKDYLLFSRAGIQKRLLADLQRGRIEVDLELDLHGLTAAYAKRALNEFLRDCARLDVRCAQIIHGKGCRSEGRQPVLKRKVNYWLRLHREVLAFCSATPREGGSGAVYVLLRNPTKARRERRQR